jgi:glycosyl transferase family 25
LPGKNAGIREKNNNNQKRNTNASTGEKTDSMDSTRKPNRGHPSIFPDKMEADFSFPPPALPEIFVINLPDAVERREFMRNQLNALGLKWRLQEGVLGKALSSKELARVYDLKKGIAFENPKSRELSLPEIGVALSHIEIYKTLVAENIGHALILEDDAEISKEVPPLLEKLTQKIPSDEAAIILLTRVRTYLRGGCEQFDGKYVFARPYKRRPWDGAYGYFITQKAAKILAEKLFPVWSVSDAWNFFQEKFAIPVKAVVPYEIEISKHDKNSTIEAARRDCLCRERAKQTSLQTLKSWCFARTFHRIFIFPVFAKKQQKRSDFQPVVAAENEKSDIRQK